MFIPFVNQSSLLFFSFQITFTEKSLELMARTDLDPQEILERILFASSDWKQMERLAKRYNFTLQTMDVPVLEDWLDAASNGTSFIIDTLRFTSAQEAHEVKKNGLRRLHSDGAGFILRCRDILKMFSDTLAKRDRTAPQSTVAFLNHVIMANSQCGMLDWNGKGFPYDRKKKKPIKKTSAIYKNWINASEGVFSISLAVLSKLAQAHGLGAMSLVLGGRGTGAKKRMGGSHYNRVHRCWLKLSIEDRVKIGLPESSYYHPCSLLIEKRKFTPAAVEFALVVQVWLAAAKAVGLASDRVRENQIKMFVGEADPNVGLYNCMSNV